MVISAFGISSSWNSRRNEGIAMPTRIMTGIRVQATSIRGLWVVRDGTGLARALNLTITVIRSASTNKGMTVMMTSSQLWNDSILSITGEPDSCSLYSHGAG